MWLGKEAWKSLFCYVSKVHFFVTESKLVPEWEYPPKGFITNFMPNALVLLGLYSAEIIHWLLQIWFLHLDEHSAGKPQSAKPHLYWNKMVSSWMGYMCVCTYTHILPSISDAGNTALWGELCSQVVKGNVA